MNGNILALGTAVPRFAISQKDVFDKINELYPCEEQEKNHTQKLYKNSGISTRYSVLEDFQKGSNNSFFGKNQKIPGMSQRNDVYKQEAIKLAHEAAEKALQEWNGDPQLITHIISVSCTGVVIPGIEFSLISSLNLKQTVNRLGINFMGCFGAFKGLEVANAFAQINPNHRILVVCTELCSLHIQNHETYDARLANSIFGDGAAAAIVGARPTGQEQAQWEMVKHHSYGMSDSEDKMRWEAGDFGYTMKLSNFVPMALSRHIESFSQALTQPYISVEECDWPIHPGGKAILQTIERKLDLDKDQTASSWKVLSDYGNMSSATFLFVLDELRKKPYKRKWAAGLGFGPGLSIEGILLRSQNY